MCSSDLHTWTGNDSTWTKAMHEFGVHSSHTWTGYDSSYHKDMHEFGVHSNHQLNGNDSSWTKYMHLFGTHGSHSSTGGSASFVINRGLIDLNDNVIISPSVPFILRSYPYLPKIQGHKHSLSSTGKFYKFSGSRSELLN